MANNPTRHNFQPINGHPSGLKIHSRRLKGDPKSLIIIWTLIVTTLFTVLFTVWFFIQLTPVGNDQTVLKKIRIPNNSSSTQIGKELEKQSIIRNAAAFDVYVRLWGKGGVLKAGTYRLSPAESTPEIVEHFVKGSVDEFKITFYPGATLTDTTKKDKLKKLDVTSVLKRAGFSEQEINSALKKKYDGPLFESKPENADLEGYIYGETYNFNSGASVEDILKTTFDEYYKQLKRNDLISKFKSKGLNLYQAIILASIIQREDGSNDDNQKKIAQVFYSRMAIDMPLGADATYQYIADKTGVPRSINLDSPYNTRRYKGLPPGPISAPGLSALKAVAEPAQGDYLYYVSGDDNITRFARTFAEHEENIARYCHEKCATP